MRDKSFQSSLLMAKALLWTMLLLTPFMIQLATIKATPETIMKVEPRVNTAEVGESFTVNITLFKVQNLFGVEVGLRWDAAILQMVNTDVRLGHPDGVLHKPIWKNETKREGQYTLYGTSMYRQTPSFNGSGNVVRITFNVTKIGGCRLNLESELRDKPPREDVASPIMHTTVDGFFGHIHINVSPSKVTGGENVTISGFITPGEANVEVAVERRQEGETGWYTISTVTTNNQGEYSYIWKPQEAGKYEVRATAVIEGKEESSSSFYITVKATQPPVWPYITLGIAAVIIVTIAATVFYRKRSTHIKKEKKKREDRKQETE